MTLTLIVALLPALALPAPALATTAGATAPNPGTAAEAPGRITLTVRDTAGIARTDEIVRQGIPIPRRLGLTATSRLVVVNAAGARVPAEFVVLGRWNAGLAATTAPIQWLLVAFPATVAANAAATYRLVYDGSAGTNPAPAKPLTIIRSGNVVTVNTGAARFTIGGTGGLVDTALNAAGTRVVSGGAMTVTTTSTARHTTIRSVRVEHAGPLYASVVITGAYGTPAIGGGAISSTRRYVFTAGSPVAEVRHAVTWEGSLCEWAVRCENGAVHGVQLGQVRDTLDLTAAAPFTVSAVSTRAGAAVTRTVAAGQTAHIRQLVRARRTAAPAFQATVAGSTVVGSRADAGMLTAGTAAGAVAVASRQLYRNEPQALRLLGNGDLAVDIADTAVWLTSRQGLYATVAVAALPANPSAATLNRLVWAPLNRPLHAWPSGDWFNQSRVVGELPAATLPTAWAGYGTHVDGVINRTATLTDQLGLSGLTTFGLYPSYWGSFEGDEVDCYEPGSDPTPATAADNTFWCSTWTDYHNTAATIVLRAMQTGAVERLDDFAVPAAQRMLHTQIMQCSPGDDWFYCGQAPAGYGGYREDFNSSHAYFENLYLYYWLTGDSTVVDTVRRGASSMREYLCDRRPAAACGPADPPTHEGLISRVASQWLAAFRFVGQASTDASFLDDWRSGLARAVTHNYIEARYGGVSYGFWVSGQVTGAGRYTTDQLWMASLYDMENLRRLQIDTDDAAIGSPALRPSRIIAAWARTLVRFGPRVAGDGTAAGRWSNALDVTFSGARLGGTLVSVRENAEFGDDHLWNSGKATLTAVIMRAAVATNDPVLLRMGTDLTRLSIEAARGEPGPLGKVQGIYLARLPAAVAVLTGSGWGV